MEGSASRGEWQVVDWAEELGLRPRYPKSVDSLAGSRNDTLPPRSQCVTYFLLWLVGEQGASGWDDPAPTVRPIWPLVPMLIIIRQHLHRLRR